MEFVEGKSLAEHIEEQGALSEKQVLDWAQELLDALIYCHAQGIIHRDVKPQNVIIRPDGHAVLVDFGLVKLWDPDDPRTQTAMRGMGTPEYAPPEQYDVATGHTDVRSDIYSLGATLYHALTDQAPPTATQRLVNPGSLSPPSSLNAGISRRLEKIILKALEPQPDQRFQSAQEMKHALDATSDDLAPIQTKKVSTDKPSQQSTKSGRTRFPSWIWISGGIVGVLVIGCCLVTSLSGLFSGGGSAAEPTSTPTPTRTPRPTATSTPRPSRTPQPTDTSTPWPSDTPTPAPTSTPASQSLYDFFNNNDNGWGTGYEDNEWWRGTQRITDGEYIWDVKEVYKSFIYWDTPIDAPDDFYVSVDAQRVRGPKDTACYCLVYRENDSGIYLLMACDDQYYTVDLFYEDEWENLIEWTKTSAIRAGEVNNLAVKAVGSNFEFFINDQLVGSVVDDTLSSGDVGVAISVNEGDVATLEFDDFILQEPEQ
jgi:serine/threonine protein kinase